MIITKMGSWIKRKEKRFAGFAKQKRLSEERSSRIRRFLCPGAGFLIKLARVIRGGWPTRQSVARRGRRGGANKGAPRLRRASGLTGRSWGGLPAEPGWPPGWPTKRSKRMGQNMLDRTTFLWQCSASALMLWDQIPSKGEKRTDNF